MELIAWILLIVFVLLDLFISITRAALFNARLPQLIDLGTEDQERLERTIKVLEAPRMRATMRFLVSIFHAMVLACVWALIRNIGVGIHTCRQAWAVCSDPGCTPWIRIPG